MADAPSPSPALIIAIASSALFDLEEADAVFQTQGKEPYRAFQRQHEAEPLRPGPAFPFIRRLLALNRGFAQALVEVVLISRNDPDTGLRVRLSCEHHDLPMGRMAFTGGKPPWPYLSAFATHLFLTRRADDVRAAIEAGFAAGEILTGARADDADAELRVAFDFDGVIADDSSERIYREQGLQAFYDHERALASAPIPPGPMARLLKAMAQVQQILRQKTDAVQLRTAIVTARNWPADSRVVTTLRSWGIVVDEAFYLGDSPKEPVLTQFRPHIFFDDRRANADSARLAGPAVHVPFGVNNPPA